MSIQTTSREAYNSILDTLGERQEQVWSWLCLMGSACSKDVSDASGIPPNVVTPRLLELREMGLVVESHRAKNPTTGRTSIYWKVAAGRLAA